MKLEAFTELSFDSPIGQLRATPVSLGEDAPKAVLATYGADFDVDPYVEMFFFPTDTLKMVVFTEKGEILWRRDLGRGVVPGIWFCPVFVFDLDGDGVDEIWYVGNQNPQHPLGLANYCLECLDARTGETTGQWQWANYGGEQSLSSTFRNFILGGHVRGEPVLVTAQGTYGGMFLQGWNPDMTLRWDTRISRDAPGARGSHMCPITDFDGNGMEAVMWGERCIELDTGRDIFCADRDAYRGHSDIIQPFRDDATGEWHVYTCRESDGRVSPRVVLYDDRGERVWGDVEQGHMDMGWVARLGEEREHVAMAIRIGAKTCGPDGRFHFDRDEFVYDALTGKPHPLPFSVYGTLPVDLDGDGWHELVRGIPGMNGDVLNRCGEVVGNVGGTVALPAKFMNRPGEQLLVFMPDGTVRLWGDREAEDSPFAEARYAHPFYRANVRLMSVGYNLPALAGI